MKVTINTDEKTISPVYPATLSELAALEGLLSARYGEGWTIVSEDFEEVTFPEIFCPNSCAPMPTVPVPNNWSQTNTSPV